MIPIITTVNTIKDKDGFSTIAEVTTDLSTDTNFCLSEDGETIVMGVTDVDRTYNRVVILNKVSDFYIKEQEIILKDINASDKFGSFIDISKCGKDNIIAVSDRGYLSSDGCFNVGCVFIYKFISGKGWVCIKELTLLDGDDDLRYRQFGNYLRFTEDGLIIGCVENIEQIYFLYKTNNFLHFNKQRINYTPPIEQQRHKDKIFIINTELNIDHKYYQIRYKQL